MSSDSGYVGRLAPSPTGALHLGNVRSFMIAWLRARSVGGKVILRIEDLDHPRDKPGADRALIDDLRWLGFDWDETYYQSERREVYRAALAKLRDRSLVYPCVCSRRDVESAQSAPHSGEQLRYNGTCRGRFDSWSAAVKYLNRGEESARLRLPCWRFRVEGVGLVEFEDVFAGRFSQDVAATLGDFPLARDPDGAGYTLASVVDDAAMGVTEIVRGDDLLPATPAQILIQKALALPMPRYCHVPLMVGPDGKRLAKRHGDSRVATYREQGRAPSEILGYLASTCHWCDRGERVWLKDLLSVFSLDKMTKKPTVLADF